MNPLAKILNDSRILSTRFLLRPLRPEDASARYSLWFEEPQTARYIVSAQESHDLPALRTYIEERIGREDILFLGIYTRECNEHIGNIKYEPIDTLERYAVMGILIGDPTWRGKGVAQEVIAASARWLQFHGGIRDVLLGVARGNRVAIAAYEKIGFREEPDARIAVGGDGICMVWHLDRSA